MLKVNILTNTHVSVQKEETPFKSRIWTFWYYDDTNSLVLDGYQETESKSGRHKPVVNARYVRLSKRDSDIEEDQVVIPPDIAEAAKAAFVARIKVCKWSERTA